MLFGKEKKGAGVKELLTLIPADFLEALSTRLCVDKRVRKLHASHLFKLVLYSLLNSERLSLRVMETNYKNPLFQALAPSLSGDTVTFNGIRERLIQINSCFFQEVYQKVYEEAQRHYSKKSLEHYHIKKYDSTMIAAFSHLIEGMRVGNTSRGKCQVKWTTALQDNFLLNMEFHQEQVYISEERALKHSILAEHKLSGESATIHVFDQGMKSRTTLQELDNTGMLFVTRIQTNARYNTLQPMLYSDASQDTQELEFQDDLIIQLYQHNQTKPMENRFRLVKYVDVQKEIPIWFLTNVEDLQAHEIADVYRQRWDIEVLFRFMKQEMNLTHFVCHHPNAIQVMMYMTMIATMLVLIYKAQQQIDSYKHAKIQFFRDLHYLILLDIMNDPQEIIRFKGKLIKLLNKSD